MKLSLALLFLLSCMRSTAQDLKPLDYALVYKKNGVTVRTCREVRYHPDRQDTVLIGIARFDSEGRMTEYQEFFAGGRLYAIYTYTYESTGRMTAAQVRHTFKEMEPVELRVECDEQHRVTALVPHEPIRNFWSRQTFTYSEKGILIKSEQWYERNGTPAPLNRKDYPSYLGSSDNSLTHLFDQRGLEVTHRFYSEKGSVDRAWFYTYE
ncbi:MAG: hypothetical protein ACK54P_03685 [Bacteroidota bacterium]